jgi:ABC-type lipoprotein export system ATPase subunit
MRSAARRPPARAAGGDADGRRIPAPGRYPIGRAKESSVQQAPAPSEPLPAGPPRDLLELHGVCVRLAGSVDVLRGVDLRVAPGDFVAVQGPSGSGKSTLLRVMAGLVAPSGGRVLVGGLDLAGRSEAELAVLRRRHVGFVHQLFDLLPDLTLLDNVQLPLLLDGVEDAEARERARQALERLGIAALAARRPEEVSGGEMLRAAVARALVIRPLVVLADEPTGSLDRENSRRVVALLRELNERHEATLVVATHDAEVASAARRMLRLVDGRLLS